MLILILKWIWHLKGSIQPNIIGVNFFKVIKVILEDLRGKISNFAGVAIIDDPKNDLNDFKKIHPYDFWLDGNFEVSNQS